MLDYFSTFELREPNRMFGLGWTSSSSLSGYVEVSLLDRTTVWTAAPAAAPAVAVVPVAA